MLNPLFRTLVKVAVASLVVGTIMAHFGITAEQLMREVGLSTERIQEYARQGFA
jgi:acetyl-CoA acetyltransferase